MVESFRIGGREFCTVVAGTCAVVRPWHSKPNARGNSLRRLGRHCLLHNPVAPRSPTPRRPASCAPPARPPVRQPPTSPLQPPSQRCASGLPNELRPSHRRDAALIVLNLYQQSFRQLRTEQPRHQPAAAPQRCRQRLPRHTRAPARPAGAAPPSRPPLVTRGRPSLASSSMPSMMARLDLVPRGSAVGPALLPPMTRRTATDGGDEQMFGAKNKSRHVSEATNE